jgi:phosphatidylglycerophosphatase A
LGGSVRDKIIKILASGFGLGFIPIAPGTFGTLLAIPFFWFLHHKGVYPYMIVTVLFTFFACFIAELAGPLFGETDSQHIVIDEVAGFLVTMTWLPRTWQAVVLGFILFRVLDALKPGPIAYVEKKIKGGLGVVADDVVAGILANMALQVIYTYTNWLGDKLS